MTANVAGENCFVTGVTGNGDAVNSGFPWWADSNAYYNNGAAGSDPNVVRGWIQKTETTPAGGGSTTKVGVRVAVASMGAGADRMIRIQLPAGSATIGETHPNGAWQTLTWWGGDLAYPQTGRLLAQGGSADVVWVAWLAVIRCYADAPTATPTPAEPTRTPIPQPSNTPVPPTPTATPVASVQFFRIFDGQEEIQCGNPDCAKDLLVGTPLQITWSTRNAQSVTMTCNPSGPFSNAHSGEIDWTWRTAGLVYCTLKWREDRTEYRYFRIIASPDTPTPVPPTPTPIPIPPTDTPTPTATATPTPVPATSTATATPAACQEGAVAASWSPVVESVESTAVAEVRYSNVVADDSMPVAIDPSLWTDMPTEVVSAKDRSGIPPRGPDEFLVQNAAYGPSGEVQGAGALEDLDWYWYSRCDEGDCPVTQGFVRIELGDAPSGNYAWRLNPETTGGMKFEKMWEPTCSPQQVWFKVTGRGASSSGSLQVTQSGANKGTIEFSTSFQSSEWKAAWIRLDDNSTLQPLDMGKLGELVVTYTQSPGSGAIEIDDTGVVIGYTPRPFEIRGLAWPTLLVTILFNDGEVVFHGGAASNGLVKEGLISTKWAIENGLGGTVLGTKYYPGTNPYSVGDVKALQGLGPYVAKDCSLACQYASAFGETRGFLLEAAKAQLVRLEQKLANPATKAEMRTLYEAWKIWSIDKIGYYEQYIAPNPMYIRMANTGVVYGLEMRASELKGPFQSGLEWYAESGRVPWDRLRLLIFSNDTADDVIRETYDMAIRNGAPRSALTVVRANLRDVENTWVEYIKPQVVWWRNIPQLIQYGLATGMSALSGAGTHLLAWAAEYGAASAGIEIAGAVAIVGVGDVGLKAYNYSQLEPWERGVDWTTYVKVNHGFTRVMIVEEWGEWAEGWAETYLTADGVCRPLQFKIPEHQISGHRYSDGMRIFLTHPHVTSVMMWRVKEVVPNDADGNYGHILLQKCMDDGSFRDFPISYEFGQGTYTMVYDHPDMGLMAMSFELLYLQHEDGRYRIGTSFFETLSPEDYAVCAGWSPTRPVDQPCQFNVQEGYKFWPDMDKDGVSTEDEQPDPNMDGLSDDAPDLDQDGLANYFDPDDDADGVPTAWELGDANLNGVADYLESGFHPSIISLPAVSR